MRVSFSSVAVLAIAVGFSACYPKDQGTESFGQHARADLVIVFRPGIDLHEINRFLDSVINEPSPSGGERHRPGIYSLAACLVADHRGYAVNFLPSATESQRQAIERAVESDPAVLKIFRNVVPNDVKLQ